MHILTTFIIYQLKYCSFLKDHSNFYYTYVKYAIIFPKYFANVLQQSEDVQSSPDRLPFHPDL